MHAAAARPARRLPLAGPPAPEFDRKEDVIYGRKFGTALTMDVFTPEGERQRRRASSSSSAAAGSRRTRRSAPASSTPLLERGYTVFAVVHGSQPKFTIPEILEDMNRAVRFIRHHAKDYGDRPGPDRHLRRLGRRPPVADAGDRRRRGRPEGQGPGGPGVEPGAGGRLLLPADRLPQLRQAGRGRPRPRASSQDFKAPFDFHELDPKTADVRPDHRRGRRSLEIGKQISPINHVTRRRPADADHPRRRRQAGADPAGRADRREAQGGRGRGEAGRQAGGRPRLARHATRTSRTFADWFDKYTGQEVGRVRRGSDTRRQRRQISFHFARGSRETSLFASGVVELLLDRVPLQACRSR